MEGRISALIEDLDVASTLLEVEVAVRRALEDPSITVVAKLPNVDAFAGDDGTSIDVPLDDRGRATPVTHEGKVIAALLHGRTADLPLMQSTARTVALAIRHIQLQAEMQAQLMEVRRSRERILSAADDARRSVERDLHDGAQQSLVALAMSLDLEKNRFDDPRVSDVLEEAAGQARRALEEIRRLSRGMYPPALSPDGLRTAIEGIIDANPIPVVLIVPDTRFDPRTEATAYFVVAEALTNTAKHGRATKARVEIAERTDALLVEVTDDGVGGASLAHGSGLQGLEDRVEAIGGTLRIHSPTGGGTTLVASIPL